jgi:hypothetical protein
MYIYIYIYICVWKCHKEIPCITILKKCLFYKIGEQEGETGPVCGWDLGWYQWERGECGEIVKEGEYGANTVYTCV